jgi:large subunit ribosomal protein L19
MVSNSIHFQNFLNREIQNINQTRQGKTFDEFRPGDTIEVIYRLMQDDIVRQGDQIEWRTQTLTGVCVGKHNNSLSSTFSVRKINDQISSFKRTFLVYSPMIQSVKLIKKGRVRRAKLNYLSKLYGKAARIKERK